MEALENRMTSIAGVNATKTKKFTRRLGQPDGWAVAIVPIRCTNTLYRSRLYLHSIFIQGGRPSYFSYESSLSCNFSQISSLKLPCETFA